MPRPLIVAMLLQFAANGSVLPFVSMFLRDRELTYDRISLVFFSASVAMLVFPFLWGMLADRFLPLDRVFVILNGCGAAALLFLSRQTEFLGLLVGFTLFSAFIVPTFMLINSLAFHHLPNPRAHFSMVRAFGSLGWIIPFLPVSLWTAIRPEAGLSFTLWFGAFFCVLMGAFALRLPHTAPGARRQSGATTGPSLYGPALKRLLRDPNYLVLLASMFLMSGSFSMVIYYSPPFLEKLGVPRPWIGPVQAVGVLFEVVLFWWQPYLVRRFRNTTIILWGCLALAVRHWLFAGSTEIWLLTLSYLLTALVVVFHHTGVSILANALAGPEVRSTAQTLLSFFGMGVGPMFANGMASWLAARANDDVRPVFLFGGILASVAALLVFARRRRLEDASRG